MEVGKIEMKNFFSKHSIKNTDFYEDYWPKIKEIDKKIVTHF